MGRVPPESLDARASSEGVRRAVRDDLARGWLHGDYMMACTSTARAVKHYAPRSATAAYLIFHPSEVRYSSDEDGLLMSPEENTIA